MTHDYSESERTGGPTSAETPVGGDNAPGQLAPGVVLQETYCIDRLLATGGMGDVYRATHRRLEGAFAVKVLHRELMREEGLLARFCTEAKIMASLHHPNIVQVFDFNVMPDGTPYLVMELAEGQDLRNVMAERRVLSPRRVVQIVKQTASALGAAHALGIIHRDLKPENVMLVPMQSQEVCVKVVDFGVSKTRGARLITIEPAVIGTPEYMSPEQAEGRNDEVDHRTDQFALGVLAYTLLTGREPFRGQTPVTVLYQVVHHEAMSLQHMVDWPCRRIDAVLKKAMSKDRHDRYPSIRDFARAFEDAVAADLADDPQGRRTTPLPAARPQAVATRARRSSPIAGERGAPTRDTFDMRAHRPQRSWRVPAMMLSAACVAAALLAFTGAGPGRLALAGDRVMAVYGNLSEEAGRLWRGELETRSEEASVSR